MECHINHTCLPMTTSSQQLLTNSSPSIAPTATPQQQFLRAVPPQQLPSSSSRRLSSPDTRGLSCPFSKHGSGSDVNHMSHVAASTSAPAGTASSQTLKLLKNVWKPNVEARKAPIHGTSDGVLCRAYVITSGTATSTAVPASSATRHRRRTSLIE